jgi:hypothetical protein
MYIAGGFGRPLEEVKGNEFIANLCSNYFVPSMMRVSEQMGRPITRVETADLSRAAPVDIELEGRETVKAGTLAELVIRLDCYSGDEVFYTTDLHYPLSELMRPEEAVGDDCWLVQIEGRPSIDVTVTTLASIADRSWLWDGDPITPGYYATAAPLLQAVPRVIAAEPGILDNTPPLVRWRAGLGYGS